MKKIIFILLFLSLFSVAYAEQVDIEIDLGVDGEWKLEKFTSLFVDIYNPGSKLTLDIEVVYTQGLRYAGYCETIYKEKVEILPLSRKKVEFLIPPIDFRYPLRVRVLTSSGEVLKDEKLALTIERITLPLVLVLSKKNIPLNISGKARVQRIYEEGKLPVNYRAYDTYDLILIDRDFWDNMSSLLKNSLTMARIFTKRVFFTDEIPSINKYFTLNPVGLKIPHNTFLYTPDLSLLEGQSFIYPGKFEILLFLSLYFLLLFLIRKFLQGRRFLIIFLILIGIFSFSGAYLGISFTKDALAVGEQSLIYLDPESYVAENFFTFSIFSPFEREISLSYSPNIFVLYNAYYQPQKGATSLIVDRKTNLLKMYTERNRVYFLEGVSYHIIPIDVDFKILSDRFILTLQNNSKFNIKNCIVKVDNKENLVGDLLKGEKKVWTVWLSGLRGPSLLSEILKKYKIKSDPIDDEKIILWGRIEDSVNILNFFNLNAGVRRDNIIIIPLREEQK